MDTSQSQNSVPCPLWDQAWMLSVRLCLGLVIFGSHDFHCMLWTLHLEGMLKEHFLPCKYPISYTRPLFWRLFCSKKLYMAASHLTSSPHLPLLFINPHTREVLFYQRLLYCSWDFDSLKDVFSVTGMSEYNRPNACQDVCFPCTDSPHGWAIKARHIHSSLVIDSCYCSLELEEKKKALTSNFWSRKTESMFYLKNMFPACLGGDTLF